jgi:hypothetical protein
MNWLIEEDSHIQDLNPLFESLTKCNVNYSLYNQENFESKLRSKDTVFFGSLQLARKLVEGKYDIKVFYDTFNYTCLNYYFKLGKYLLNGNYIMLPFNELIRQKEFLFSCVSQDRAVFIRPNREDKIFTGTLVYKESYEIFIDSVDFKSIIRKIDLSKELVIVSEPKNIDNEWRFVCVDGIIVTGSTYRKNGKIDTHQVFDSKYKKAMNFAQEVACTYQPDVVFIVDVCTTENSNSFSLMEIGPFSCAGLYDCDNEVIVERIKHAY